MTPAATIRPARPGDAAALAGLHALGFEEGWSIEDFRGWLCRPGAFSVLAESEGQTRAFGLALSAADDVELLTITTGPPWRGHGLGGQIFDALNRAAGVRGHSRWVLEVATDNLPALALYRRHGFVEIGRRKGYYRRADGRCDALVMACDVPVDRC